MNISINKMVTLSYVLRAESKDGEIIEQTSPENPLKFVFGAGSMLPQFESNLTGKTQGEDFEMLLSAQNAYGEVDEEAIVELPKDIFVIDGNFDEERFQSGAVVPMQSADGRRMNGTILEIVDDIIRMDFNHPLAGLDLYFTGNIIEVREATEEELAPAMGCGCGSGGCGSHNHDDDHGCSDSGCGCSSGGCC
jgi:FKBP-type peptidyl-prolyl cis-trans isomerase SlyD